MIYKLEIIPQARKEWDKLHPTIKDQLKNKLKERLHAPRTPKDKLSGLPNCYKIVIVHLPSVIPAEAGIQAKTSR